MRALVIVAQFFPIFGTVLSDRRWTWSGARAVSERGFYERRARHLVDRSCSGGIEGRPPEA